MQAMPQLLCRIVPPQLVGLVVIGKGISRACGPPAPSSPIVTQYHPASESDAACEPSLGWRIGRLFPTSSSTKSTDPGVNLGHSPALWKPRRAFFDLSSTAPSVAVYLGRILTFLPGPHRVSFHPKPFPSSKELNEGRLSRQM